jgi:hypothetical protein
MRVWGAPAPMVFKGGGRQSEQISTSNSVDQTFVGESGPSSLWKMHGSTQTESTLHCSAGPCMEQRKYACVECYTLGRSAGCTVNGSISRRHGNHTHHITKQLQQQRQQQRQPKLLCELFKPLPEHSRNQECVVIGGMGGVRACGMNSIAQTPTVASSGPLLVHRNFSRLMPLVSVLFLCKN